MQVPDLYIATKYLDYAECAAWSQTRQIMLCTLKPYLKKKNITAAEFFPLPTDSNEAKNHTTIITNEELKWFNENKDYFAPKKKLTNINDIEKGREN